MYQLADPKNPRTLSKIREHLRTVNNGKTIISSEDPYKQSKNVENFIESLKFIVADIFKETFTMYEAGSNLTPYSRNSKGGEITVDIDSIFSKSRRREFVVSRQIYSYILKNYLGSTMTLSKIGEAVGHNHATAIHSIKNVENILSNENDIYHDYAEVIIKNVQSKYIFYRDKNMLIPIKLL